MPEPGNPQALNRYSYVLNNPLRYTDPTGHCIPGFGKVCEAGEKIGDVGGKVGSMAKDLATDKIPRYGPLVTCTAPGPACAVAIGSAAGDCVGKGVEKAGEYIAHPETMLEDAHRLAHTGVDIGASTFYTGYFLAYYTLEFMPPEFWAAHPQLYALMLGAQGMGLAGNTEFEAVEVYVLGADEYLFDDAQPDKSVVPEFLPEFAQSWMRTVLHRLGIAEERYLPGIRSEPDWHIDWSWGGFSSDWAMPLLIP